jgi:regulator of protease activity HflC (stomatin/prohibitin superfamily)
MLTLNNGIQKVNDEMGNPIEIGVIVILRVTNTARARFVVNDYSNFVSIQADSSVRHVARLFPYDKEGTGEKSLRGSTSEIAQLLKSELQTRVSVAGIEIVEARIAHLAYAPEIASAMLQRQQATAIIEARQKIVEGAVGMVENTLKRLEENKICNFTEGEKSSTVSNLLIVLCSNKDATPVLNIAKSNVRSDN